MKRRKSPQQRKAESYKKDRRSGAEYPHASRKGKPRRKARGNRRARRQVRQAFSSELRHDDQEVNGSAVEMIRRTNDVWSMSIALGDRVKTQRWKRLLRTGDNFFRYPYDRERDRLGFSRFLESVVRGKSQGSSDLAKLLSVYLEPSTLVQTGDRRPAAYYLRSHVIEKHEWLERFLEDEPRWRARLHGWTRKMLGH